MTFRWPSVLALALVSLVGVAAFTWPFFASAEFSRSTGHDAPWLFALLLALLALVLLAEVTAEGLDAKAIAVLGVLAAMGGALRVLSAGTTGIEPMFFLLALGGRVLGPSKAFLLGCFALLGGAFLTGGVGPWTPFQMFGTGWFALGAACLPRASGWPERLLLAGYGVVASLGYGVLLNLSFWPFLAAGAAPSGAGFVPGAPLSANLAHYGLFYLLTSLGYDVPRAFLTAVLILLVGPAVLRTLRRAVRRASFDAGPSFEPADAGCPATATGAPAPRRTGA